MNTPRVIRISKAPEYLGMDRRTFKSKIRPYLNIIKLHGKGLGIDRLELDAIWEKYKQENIVEPAREWHSDEEQSCLKEPLGYSTVTASGTSTRRLKGSAEFDAVRKLATSITLKDV